MAVVGREFPISLEQFVSETLLLLPLRVGIAVVGLVNAVVWRPGVPAFVYMPEVLQKGFGTSSKPRPYETLSSLAPDGSAAGATAN